jgi:hypothetical protein
MRRIDDSALVARLSAEVGRKYGGGPRPLPNGPGAALTRDEHPTATTGAPKVASRRARPADRGPLRPARRSRRGVIRSSRRVATPCAIGAVACPCGGRSSRATRRASLDLRGAGQPCSSGWWQARWPIENFGPGRPKSGARYDVLAEINPGLIMVRCRTGQTDPTPGAPAMPRSARRWANAPLPATLIDPGTGRHLDGDSLAATLGCVGRSPRRTGAASAPGSVRSSTRRSTKRCSR